MKSDLHRTTPILFALVAIIVGLARAQTSGAPPNIAYDWRFSTPANPAAPVSAVGGLGAAQAAIAPGLFSHGWLSNIPSLGAAQGLWDLGKSGVICLTNPAGLAGGSARERLITVSVRQYQDGGIYGHLATVSVPGATLVGSTNSRAASAGIGQWTVAQTLWRDPAGTPVNSILITGVPRGSLVDRVTVESSYRLKQP